MYEFTGVSCSATQLSANCLVEAQWGCFDGHFPGYPMMPAAAQLMMVEALLNLPGGWNMKIQAAQNVKFLQHLIPGDNIHIQLERKPDFTYTIRLSRVGGSVVSKGVLRLVQENNNG